jgi:transcriptional regulator with XRE-family HTH domain
MLDIGLEQSTLCTASRSDYMSYPNPQTHERVKSLEEFARKVLSINPKNDEEFRNVFAEAQQLLEMSDQQIADAISVSRPSVNRWINGKNLPHFALRKPILTWVSSQIESKRKVVASTIKTRVASPSSYGRSYGMPIAAKSR